MMTRFFSSPIFPEDDKTSSAHFISTIVVSNIPILVLFIVVRILTGSAAFGTPNLILVAIIAILTVVWFLMRAGWVRLAGYLHVSTIWVASTLIAIHGGGIRGIAIASYFVVMLMAGLLLGWKPAMGYIICSVFAAFGIVVAENAGVIQYTPEAAIGAAIDGTVLLIFGGIFLFLIINSLQRSVKKVKATARELALSNQFTDSIINLSPDILYIYDIVSQQNVYCSAAIQKVLGYSALEIKEMGNRIFPLLMHPDDLGRYVQEILSRYAKVKDHEPVIHEYRMRHKDGEWRWLRSNEVVYERTSDGSPIQIFGIVHDITESKQAEEALRESESQFRELWGATVEGIVIHDMGKILEVNDAICRIFRSEREQVIGKSLLDFTPPEMRDRLRERIASGIDGSFETPALRADGTKLILEVFAKEIHYHGKLARMVAIRDITDRKRAEEALSASEENYRLLFENNPAPMWVYDVRSLVFLAVNDFAIDHYGYTREEFLSMTIRDIRPPEDIPYLEETLNRSTEQIRKVGTARHRKKDGSLIHVEITGHDIEFEGRRAMLVLAMDITERNRAETARRQSEAQLTAFLNFVPALVLMKDDEFRPIYANDKYASLFPIEEWMGKKPEELFPPEVADGMIQKDTEAMGRGYTDYEETLTDKQGEHRVFYTQKFKITVPESRSMLGVVISDITERKRAEVALRESEERFSVLSDASFEGIVVSDRGRVIDVNRQMAQMLGYEPSEMIGLAVENFVAPESLDLVMQHIRSGSEEPYEHIALRKDGERFPVEIRAKSIPYKDKSVRVTAVRDLTERKRTEEELRTVISSAHCLLWNARVERDGDNYAWDLHVSNEDAAAAFLPVSIPNGIPFSEAWQRSKFDEERPKLDSDYREALEHGELGYSHEFRCRLADGSVRWLFEDVRIAPQSEHRWNLVGVCTDITERKLAEETLKRYQLLSQNTRDIILFLRATDGHILEANDAAVQAYGYDREELMTKSIRDLRAPETLDELTHQIQEANLTGISLETLHLRRDGTMFPVEVSARGMTVGHERILLSIIRDITDRKRAEQRIEEQARLLDVARDAIIVRDINDKLLYMNRAAQELYGWTFEEAQAISPEELMLESDREKFPLHRKAFMEKGEWEGELRQRTKDGKEINVQTRWTLVRDKDGRPAARLIINRDITEQHRLEAQFRRAQRLESLGTLAGGIAHDLNNVLAPIMMSLALLDRRVTDPHLKKHIATLEASAQRGSDIVKQVLLFARGSEKDFAPQQLRYVIREITTIVQETFPRSIELVTDIAKDLPFVMGDATQLHQVLMNLCVNARDAMPEGGWLTIAASKLTMSETDARLRLGGKPGEYIVLSITDTGSGMPREIQEKIFEPFFTTKDPGKGTGLGLSTVYAIVKDHKGFINLYSEVGKGTSFKVYLPAIQHEEVTKPTAPPTGIGLGRGEVILVVDDEQAVLEITREILEVRGFKVLTATNGAEAISVFAAAAKGSIQLVLTDVNMPGMDGPTAVEAIRKLDPNVKVIIASGLVADLDSANKKDLQIQGYLMKPYTSERMFTMIHELLGS